MSQHTEFVNTILSTYRPADVSTIVRHRNHHAELLNEEISDWLKERVKIEESYALALEKLSQKKISEIPNSGIFASVWANITSQTRDASKASAMLAHKISHEIEQPLRKFCTRSGQWSDFRELNNQLEIIAQNFSHTDKKKSILPKHHHQGENAETRSQWENQAPYILEQIGTIDESRLGILKNSLISYETLEADRSQRMMKSTETVLNNVLSFEPIDDIAAFSAQAGRALERTSSHRPANRGSISELSDVQSNRADSLYEHPRSPVKKEEGGSSFKLRSKVGSIFRPRKGKSPSVSLPNPQSSSARPSSPSVLPSAANVPLPAIASEDYSASAAKSLKPAPPPARKSANGVSLSTAAPREDLAAPPIPDSDIVNIPPPHSEIPNEHSSFVAEGDQAPKFALEDSHIVDGNEEDNVALSSVASQLGARSTPSRRGRGRRDVQSTLFTNIVPSELDSSTPNGGSTTISPIEEDQESPNDQVLPGTPSFVSESNAPQLSATPSLRSALPLTAGFRAGISQHVGANVQDGETERANLVGEVSFAYDGPPQSVNVKFENSEILDKIIPNYSLLKGTDESVFQIDTQNITGPEGKLGFKILLKDSKQFVPVDFTPYWRIEADKSRLMLTYKLADSYLTTSPVILKDVTITVPVEGGKALAAHSKPKVIFNQNTQSVAWKFDELIVKAGIEEKLLCQFDTDGPASEGRQGIDVKFRLEGHEKFSLRYSTADEPLWKPVNTLVSLFGRFTLHSEKNVETNL